MTLSMPQSRKTIHKQDEVAERLRKGLKAAGLLITRRKTKRDTFIETAKSGRPPNLREEARQAVAERRRQAEVQKSLDDIAGRVE